MTSATTLRVGDRRVSRPMSWLVASVWYSGTTSATCVAPSATISASSGAYEKLMSSANMPSATPRCCSTWRNGGGSAPSVSGSGAVPGARRAGSGCGPAESIASNAAVSGRRIMSGGSHAGRRAHDGLLEQRDPVAGGEDLLAQRIDLAGDVPEVGLARVGGQLLGAAGDRRHAFLQL